MILVVLLKLDFSSQESAYLVADPITNADIGIQDLSFIQTRSGEIEWEISARSAELFESEHRAALENARVVLRTPDGLAVSIEGDRGMINTDNHDFKMEGQDNAIRLEITNGYTILTKELEWKDREHLIRSSHPVRILGPWFVIDGVGLIIDTLSQEFKISEGVHVTFKK